MKGFEELAEESILQVQVVFRNRLIIIIGQLVSLILHRDRPRRPSVKQQQEEHSEGENLSSSTRVDLRAVDRV
ncbi:hypothetical protein NL676_003701 [Syzygium grande]|nr:hypothetical protein NL676_003701 [Syzygium grande]